MLCKRFINVNTVFLSCSSLADPDIGLGGQFNMFPVSHVNFFVGEGRVYIAKLYGVHGRICPSGSATVNLNLQTSKAPLESHVSSIGVDSGGGSPGTRPPIIRMGGKTP